MRTTAQKVARQGLSKLNDKETGSVVKTNATGTTSFEEPVALQSPKAHTITKEQ